MKVFEDDRGSQTVELVALFPFILFVFLFVWQVGLAAYTVVVAESAARDGARVASSARGGDDRYEEAIRHSAYGLTIKQIDKEEDDDRVTVTLTVDMVNVRLPLINRAIELQYTARATMPREAGLATESP
ncbi:MAG: pilus assembly protein [Hydrogenibacillus schlegelii]|uniref:Pilus assembly protein n=1 Tax=Hydrogenibacillus schlegelii TaxID=1484 RepID=A0A947D2Z2_HYDSH|nr:pilus assembly protein [Hydrogenibacillus schlegelii]